MEKVFGFGSIIFLDIFPVDLDDGWEAIDDELFEKGRVGNGVALGLDDKDLQVDQILQFGNLQQRHDVALLEL